MGIVKARHDRARAPDIALGPTGHKPTAGQDYLLAAIPALIALIFSLLLISPFLSDFGDNARFMILAESLVGGQGFAILSTPGNPPDKLYPYGYPLLLAIQMRFMGSQPELAAIVDWLKLSSTGFFVGSLLLTYRLVAKQQSRSTAFSTSLLVALSPLALRFSSDVMSEIPFLLFSLVAILLLQRAVQGPYSPVKDLAAGIAMAFAFYVRTIGAALIVTGLIYVLLRCGIRRLAWMTLLLLVLLTPWLYQQTAVTTSNSYFAQFARLSPQVQTESEQELAPWHTFWQRPIGNLKGYLLFEIPISNRRLRNWFMSEISAHFRLSRPLGLPTHLQTEPTNRCNLRCIVCPITTGEMKRPQGSMDAASFAKLMGEIGDSLLLLLLWEWGEPFLNDNLCQLIAAAKAHGVSVTTSTNGHFIQDAGRAREIVESGLDTLVFAVDGVTSDTYRIYRRGGQFDRVLGSIREMVDTRKALGAKNPLLVLQFIVMRHNRAQIAAAIDLAKHLGVDVLSLRTANPFHHEFEQTHLPDDPRYRQFDYVDNTLERIRKPNSCKRFWNMPAVQWNGTVSHCEFDIDGEYELGNAFDRSFRDIWLGRPYRMARQAFALRRPITRPCSDCIYNFSSVHDIVADAVPLSDAARLAVIN